MTTAMKGFFRLVAAALKEESSATSVAGIGVLVFSLYIGLYYSSAQHSGCPALDHLLECRMTSRFSSAALKHLSRPLGFGVESLMMNEFHTLLRSKRSPCLLQALVHFRIYLLRARRKT